MNKISSILFTSIFILISLITFTACDDDEPDPAPSAPTATAPTGSSASLGEAIELEFAYTSAAGFKSASVTASAGTATIPTLPAAGSTSGTIKVSFTAPDAEGDATVSLTVTDEDSKTTKADATVTVGKAVVDITDPAVTDATLGDKNTIYNLSKDVTYMFDGLVYVEEGSVLNIPAGTLIRFKNSPSTGDNTSALFITKGAKIMAEGTKDEPIIFTAELDDLSYGVLKKEDNGQWGGLVILGNAPAEKGGSTSIQIEGIDSEETRGQYGGSTADDNSGVLKYVSIRYTGIGFTSGNELQGLTLGGVGSGTTVDYIDIFSSADDGIEIFGGTVNIKHVSVAFSTDDDFDFDLGYKGNAQFLFSIMRSDEDGYDHAGEWDGASPDDAALYSAPNIFNATMIGPGQDATGRDKALLWRENFAGKLGHSILVDYPSKGLEVQDLGTGKVDCLQKMTDGELEILNNIWSSFKGVSTTDDLIKITSKDGDDNPITPREPEATTLKAELTDNNNTVSETSVINGISRDADGGLDPTPSISDFGDVATALPEGIESTDYKGAFAPGENWLADWSSLAKFGFLK